MDANERKFRLRDMLWDFGCDDKTIIYDNGHLDRAEFLAAVKAARYFDIDPHTIQALSEEDVKHMIVRRLSPSEARSHGVDWGFMEDGGRIKLTAVIV